jgi:hypothetical protein
MVLCCGDLKEQLREYFSIKKVSMLKTLMVGFVASSFIVNWFLSLWTYHWDVVLDGEG